MKSVLYSAVATHRHAREIARALKETNRLGLWHTGWIHAPQSSLLGKVFEQAARWLPPVQRGIRRRSVDEEIPFPLQMRWKSELFRIAVESGLKQKGWGHAVWEWHEHELAKDAAGILRREGFKRYLGIEHGALEALQECRRLGRQSCLMFTSPHHSFWEKWARIGDQEHRLGSHLGANGERLMRRCYERVDEEIQLADVIRTNSSLVRQTLIDVRVDPKKIANVPLGADIRQMRPCLPLGKDGKLRLAVSGQVSPRKGSHLLLQAWKELSPAGAELHFYGGVHLPREKLAGAPESVKFHGNVDPEILRNAYRQSQVLVFPTLCDGFGMVVPEAMVEGCAVLTTRNAGAADWVEEGKNGWVVEAGSVSALKEGLEKVFACRDKWEEMRAAAQETARGRTWDDFRIELIQSLLDIGFLN
jgi:glycosyltransferase involved in cell wall biosynthesis